MKKNSILLFLILTYSLYGQTIIGEYEINNLKINTKLSDFGTNFFGKDKIVFAAPKKNQIIKIVWDVNNQPFLDLYIGDISENGEIINKKRIKGNVNTKLHEAGISFTKDLKTVYFTSNNYHKTKARKGYSSINNLQLFKAEVTSEGEWVNIIRLPFNSDEFSTGHPALSLDEKKLYFTSDRPESIGETDIFVVNILKNNTYSTPKNLSKAINTIEAEMFPFVSNEGVLYFSSNGHRSLGGLDIFASKIFNSTYSIPINIKPINSNKDDFAFIINSDNKGYFSSNRNSGKGDDDIYRFIASKTIDIKCNAIINGVIKSVETGELLPGATVILLDASQNELQRTIARAINANFSFDVLCNNNYKIIATHNGYFDNEKNVSIPNDIGLKPLEVDLLLKNELKIIDEKLLANINPIYFDLDKHTIRPAAALKLDKVVNIMNKYPTIKIEASSHTDSRANNSYNIILSEKRAQSTVEYIISKGISPNRIYAKGYGESQLTNECSSKVNCSRAKHQLNRRTEFRVTN